MKHLRILALSAAAATLLAACAVEAPSRPTSSQPAPPAAGFAPEVSNAAVEACRRALDAQTDGAIDVTGTEFSQANNAVYRVVGANRAPWMCLVSSDAVVQELRFIGSEGGA
jgi:hypothetical protein